MTDRQLFGVLVRVFGLAFLFMAITDVVMGIAQLLDKNVLHKFPPNFDFTFAVIEVLIAWGFVHWADRVVHLAYRSSADPN